MFGIITSFGIVTFGIVTYVTNTWCLLHHEGVSVTKLILVTIDFLDKKVVSGILWFAMKPHKNSRGCHFYGHMP
jgi:hypothetical protein